MIIPCTITLVSLHVILIVELIQAAQRRKRRRIEQAFEATHEWVPGDARRPGTWRRIEEDTP